MSSWNPAGPREAAECESAFQAGGPRVFTYRENGPRPSAHSAPLTVRLSDVGTTVYARRKDRAAGSYSWFACLVQQ